MPLIDYSLWMKMILSFRNHFLAIIGWRDRNTNITVLLEFNMMAYVKHQIHTKLLFLLALSTLFSLVFLTISSLKEKITVNKKMGGQYQLSLYPSLTLTSVPLSFYCSFVFPEYVFYFSSPSVFRVIISFDFHFNLYGFHLSKIEILPA